MFVAALAGAGLAVQSAVNTQLRAATGSALWTSLISATLTVILLAATQLFVRESMTVPTPSQHPWWMWIGGIMGAVYVFVIVAFTRYLGVALVFAAIVGGQLLTGLLIDHYGWFNVSVHRVSPGRALGAVLLVAGMALIRWR
jgi:bacterial/archaeal transporter family-2 protein